MDIATHLTSIDRLRIAGARARILPGVHGNAFVSRR